MAFDGQLLKLIWVQLHSKRQHYNRLQSKITPRDLFESRVHSALQLHYESCPMTNKIKGGLFSPKWMNFRRNSKKPLTPPPPAPFSGNFIAIFQKFLTIILVASHKICSQIFQIGNDTHPPFGVSPKIHPFWRIQASLNSLYLL